MSYEHVNAIGLNLHLTAPEKSVLTKLALNANKDGGSIYPSIDELVSWTSLAKRTVYNVLKDAVIAGLLTREGTHGRQTLYRMHIEAIKSFSGAPDAPGQVQVVHGAGDAPVQVVHPRGAGDALSGAGGAPTEERARKSPSSPKKLPREEYIDTPEWLIVLRDIEGWDASGKQEARGRQYEKSLMRWRSSHQEYTDDQLEGAAIALSAAQAKTLRGYKSIAAAFQTWARKGYGDPARQDTSNNGYRPVGRKKARSAEEWGVKQ